MEVAGELGGDVGGARGAVGTDTAAGTTIIAVQAFAEQVPELLRVVCVALANLDVGQSGAAQALDVVGLADRATDATLVERLVVAQLLRKVLDNHVRDEHAAAGFQDAGDLGEDAILLRREVNHAIGDDPVDRPVLHRELLDEALADLGIVEPRLCDAGPCAVEHLGGHVDADDAARRADPTGCQQHVQTGPAAEIDDGVAGLDLGERQWIAAAERGVDGTGRKRRERLLFIAGERRGRARAPAAA